jgi:hypothetical protein
MEELVGKTIANVTFVNGSLVIDCTDGFQLSANGGNMDTTFMQVLDNNGKLVVHETQSF